MPKIGPVHEKLEIEVESESSVVDVRDLLLERTFSEEDAQESMHKRNKRGRSKKKRGNILFLFGKTLIISLFGFKQYISV